MNVTSETNTIEAPEQNELDTYLDTVRRVARYYANEGYDTDWISETLALVGCKPVARNYGTTHTVTLNVTGTVQVAVEGKATHAEAVQVAQGHLARWNDRTRRPGNHWLDHHLDSVDVANIIGPDDDASVEAANRPASVEAAKEILRRELLRATYTGPRYCHDGVSRAWRKLELGDMPEARTYEIKVPVNTTVTTTVFAYSEDDALNAYRAQVQDHSGGVTHVIPKDNIDFDSVTASVAG